jgi:hypothetical protein
MQIADVIASQYLAALQTGIENPLMPSLNSGQAG